MGRTRHTWARSQPSFSRGPVPPLPPCLVFAVGHRWLSARGTHLLERHRKCLISSNFLTPGVRESRRGASRAAESPTTLGSEPAPVPPPQSASLHRGEAGSLTAAERVREKPGPAFRTNSSLALPLLQLDCRGGGNSAEFPLVSSLVGKQGKLSSTHCSLAVRFVPGLSRGCEQSNPKFTSPVRRRFMCGLDIWCLRISDNSSYKKNSDRKVNFACFYRKKKDAPHPHAKYTAAYVMFFSKGV